MNYKKILAVDTATLVATVAVMEGETLLGEYFINHKKTHSQKLMPMIQELLTSLELTPQDIDFFAVSTGPGSFTGLRIGVTTIKAMAFATQKPVIAIPTLDGLAGNIPVGDFCMCPIMDARNNQVYTAIYNAENNLWKNSSGYLGIYIHEIVQKLKALNTNVMFNGDGVQIHKDFLKSELGDKCFFAPCTLMHQRAATIAQLAAVKAMSGEVETSFELVPFYLRKSQAEREFESKGL